MWTFRFQVLSPTCIILSRRVYSTTTPQLRPLAASSLRALPLDAPLCTHTFTPFRETHTHAHTHAHYRARLCAVFFFKYIFFVWVSSGDFFAPFAPPFAEEFLRFAFFEGTLLFLHAGCCPLSRAQALSCVSLALPLSGTHFPGCHTFFSGPTKTLLTLSPVCRGV